MKLTRYYDLTEAEMKDAFLHFLAEKKGVVIPTTVLGSYAVSVSVTVRGSGDNAVTIGWTEQNL